MINKQTGIAVVVGVLIVFLLVGGKGLIGNMTGGTSAVVTSQDNTNTQNTMPQVDDSQLQSKDEVVGSGDIAVAGKQVTVNYTGVLKDGTKFDSSLDRGVPFTFLLGAGQVIKGWDIGVQGMKVGGKRILVIPAEFGYGAQKVGSIPANSTLIFEVELLKVQ